MKQESTFLSEETPMVRERLITTGVEPQLLEYYLQKQIQRRRVPIKLT